MAITLKVTPEELQSTASDFQAKNRNVQQYTQNMLQLINSVSGDIWSGEAATAYTSKFRGLEKDISTLCAKLDKSASNLIQIASEYSSTESANVSAASALSNSLLS